jgi:hypothetical protein
LPEKDAALPDPNETVKQPGLPNAAQQNKSERNGRKK